MADTPTPAQQAVNVVAAVMAGHPQDDVALELDHWLARRGAVLDEKTWSATVEAISGGSTMVILDRWSSAAHRLDPVAV